MVNHGANTPLRITTAGVFKCFNTRKLCGYINLEGQKFFGYGTP